MNMDLDLIAERAALYITRSELAKANERYVSLTDELWHIFGEQDRRDYAVQAKEIMAELAEARKAAAGKWEDPNALQLAHENFEVNSCDHSWRVDTEGVCPICAKEPAVRKEVDNGTDQQCA
jgi:hypothetical protein